MSSVIAPAQDSSWFYSSLSQVTAAIVGFVGGFLILRLLNYMTEWRELRSRLETIESAWLIQQRAVDNPPKDILTGQVALEADRLWMDLSKVIGERKEARMPRELLIGAALLGVLLLVGSVWPLLALEAPSEGRQLQFLIPWIVVLLVFGIVMAVQAGAILKQLQNFRLTNSTQGLYDTQQAEREGWRLLEEQQRREKKQPPAPEEESG